MGEIFRKPTPSIQLSWTGERLTSGALGEVEIEHFHRYLLARELTRGLDVIDVASGEGYGSSLIAQSAKSVLGVELSEDAASHAQREYGNMNLRFEVGDARALPAADASMDVVVSFETLEHFFEHEQFFLEARRVLRPTGFLLVSTPDLNVYSPSRTAPNPYHVHELTYQEFEKVLRRNFKFFSICGQRMIAGSILGAPDSNGETITFERRDEGFFEASRGIPRAKYLLGVASMAQLPPIPSSFLSRRRMSKSFFSTRAKVRREIWL